MMYSIGTLVTDWAQYQAMRSSFEQHGFGSEDCEFLQIDNTKLNQKDAYAGCNELLNEARGRYVILCHQDVRIVDDSRKELDAELARLEEIDPNWAVAGNAGGVSLGRLALRLTDPHGINQFVGDLPAKVASLDENFLVVKRSARVGFSRDLSSFHFYGTDICLNADILGYSAYVIDFHLLHLSPGTTSHDFFAAKSAFQRKWSYALRSRWLQTTCTMAPVAGTRFGRAFGSFAVFTRRGLKFLKTRISRGFLRTSTTNATQEEAKDGTGKRALVAEVASYDSTSGRQHHRVGHVET